MLVHLDNVVTVSYIDHQGSIKWSGKPHPQLLASRSTQMLGLYNGAADGMSRGECTAEHPMVSGVCTQKW